MKSAQGKHNSTPTGIARSLEALCITERPRARQGLGRDRVSQELELDMSKRHAVRRCVGSYFHLAVNLVSEPPLG